MFVMQCLFLVGLCGGVIVEGFGDVCVVLGWYV